MHNINCLVLVLAAVSRLYGLKDVDLTIGGIFPMSGSWAGGMACKPAVQLALDMVNNQTKILSHYRLAMQYNDSQCMPGLGTKVLYQLLYKEPTKIMVLTGCSSVSTFVARAASMWNLIVLAYGASSPALSDRDRFPMFFRTHPSATLHNPARMKLFQRFNWRRIATIQETQETFTSTIEDLERRVKESDLEITVRQSFLTDPTNAVRNLKRLDARIIVGVFYEDMARRVFCQAYREKLYGKRYVWLIIGWYPDNWYRVEDDRHNCTAEQLEEALEGHLTTEAVILHQELTMTDVGMTSADFTSRLNGLLNTSDPSLLTGYPEAPLAYDAVWALAFALDRTASRLADRGMKLEEFDYYNASIAQEIYSAMNSTKFLGISGNVAFSSQGDRIARTQIEQMRDGTYHKLGFYDAVADNLSWLGTDQWLGGKPPPDETRVIVYKRVVSHLLYIGMCLLATSGILAAIACLVFNRRYRHRRCVAYSQPGINNLIVLGCILCFCCIFLLGLDGTYSFITPQVYSCFCQMRAWLLCVGFTLSFGGMFSKVLMVHQLTIRRKEELNTVGSWEIYSVLSVLLLLDIIILVSWQVLDPLHLDVETFALELPTNTHEDIRLQPQLEHCMSNNITIWLGVLFGYKGIILMLGVFLAYETRSVKLRRLIDSRFVGMSIYNIVVLCVITGPISLIIGGQQDAAFAFVAFAIILCCFLSMALIFVPKVVELTKFPDDTQNSFVLADAVVSREADGGDERLHLCVIRENEQLRVQIAETEGHVMKLKQRLQLNMPYPSTPLPETDFNLVPSTAAVYFDLPYSSPFPLPASITTATSTTAAIIPCPIASQPAAASDGMKSGGPRARGVPLSPSDQEATGNQWDDSGLASWSQPHSPDSSECGEAFV